MMNQELQDKNWRFWFRQIKDFFLDQTPVGELSEEQRKGRVFTYFIGAAWLALAGVTLMNIYLSFIWEGEAAQIQTGYLPGNLGVLTITALIWLGHRWYPSLMRHVFLVIMTLSIMFLFELNLLDRIAIAFTLPVVMASFLIGPLYSFAYYALVTGIYTFRFYQAGFTITSEEYSYINIIALLIMAFVSWLIAQSLDKALAEARALNVELDQRVQDRTQELAESLGREHAIATQNRTILTSIADGIVVFDAQQRVVVANPAASDLTRQDLQSLTAADFLAPIDDEARATLQAWLHGTPPKGQKNVRFEWRNRTLSANVAPVALIEEEHKRVDIGNVMVLRDFTREAELERAKDLFLSTVSHELRTPMSAIQGYVEVLLALEKERMSADGYGYLQTINVSIKQLLTLANELIDLSRLETGEIDLYCDWVELTPIVNNAVKIVQQEFTGKNLSLEVNIEEPLPKLYLDDRRILQILLNLLSNAYKYTLEGGAIINIDQSDKWVNISVSDTGIGIKERDQAKLFKRFFRADDPRVQRAGGSGLGLNITKGFTELHGGQLTYESHYGKGTTVTVSLPKDNSASFEGAE